MGHCFSHLQLTDRRKIEYGLNRGDTPKQIAAELHVHVSTNLQRNQAFPLGVAGRRNHGLQKTDTTRTERNSDTAKTSRQKAHR